MPHSCVNLRALFGHQYLVRYEETRQVDRSEENEPWYQLLPCGGRGHICPWGGQEIAACVDRPRLVKTLVALGGRLQQDGDDGGTVVFDVSDFAKVADVMKPIRRRQLSIEQRRACAERLQAAQRRKSA